MSIVSNIITPPNMGKCINALCVCMCHPSVLSLTSSMHVGEIPYIKYGLGEGVINLIITCNTAQLAYSCTPYSYSKSKVTHWILCVPRGLCCPCTDPEVYIVQPREISKYLAVLHYIIYQLLVGNQLWQCVLTPGAQD